MPLRILCPLEPLRALARLPRKSATLKFEELGIYRLLLAGNLAHDHDQFVTQMLGLILRGDGREPLRATVARQLGVHQNTIKYRMQQLRAAFGRDPSRGDLRLAIELALKLRLLQCGAAAGHSPELASRATNGKMRASTRCDQTRRRRRPSHGTMTSANAANDSEAGSGTTPSRGVSGRHVPNPQGEPSARTTTRAAARWLSTPGGATCAATMQMAQATPVLLRVLVLSSKPSDNSPLALGCSPWSGLQRLKLAQDSIPDTAGHRFPGGTSTRKYNSAS